MPKVTITIEDLPAGDPNGDFRATVDFEPTVTKEQQTGFVPLTTAQQVGAHMAGVLRSIMNPTNGHNHHAEVIDIAPASNGAPAEVVELKEGGQ